MTPGFKCHLQPHYSPAPDQHITDLHTIDLKYVAGLDCIIMIIIITITGMITFTIMNLDLSAFNGVNLIVLFGNLKRYNPNPVFIKDRRVEICESSNGYLFIKHLGFL